MAGTVVADTLQADSTSTLVIKNGVANTPPTIQDSAGTQIGTFCRAWVNFNGTATSGSATIRSNFNVSSVTANATGDFTVTFTTAMPDANYSFQGNGSMDAAGFFTVVDEYAPSATQISPRTASSIRIQVRAISAGPNFNTTATSQQISISIFR